MKLFLSRNKSTVDVSKSHAPCIMYIYVKRKHSQLHYSKVLNESNFQHTSNADKVLELLRILQFK